jgi:hypothetical protein
MSGSAVEQPTILVPYKPDGSGRSQDVFIYLRPETNGIEVESRMMRVVQQNHEFRNSIELAYLANFPGSFIHEQQIVERHYHVRIYFARCGGEGFTPFMKESFQRYFAADPRKVPVLGAFEAMETLGMDAEKMFRLWVPDEDMAVICGQSVKRLNNHYIVNYDIPAILSKNNVNTDIAVMVFRTSLGYSRIHQLVASIGEELQKAALLRKDVPLSRAFHYSKGPFEQILDATGYVFEPDGTPVPVRNSSFYCFLEARYGFKSHEILGALNQPIMRFGLEGGLWVEDEIFAYTQNDSFEEAAEKLSRVLCQSLLPVDCYNLR